MNDEQKSTRNTSVQTSVPDKTLPSPDDNYRIIPLEEYQQYKDDQEAVKQLRQSLMTQLSSDEELIEALRTQISSLKWQLQEYANQSSVASDTDATLAEREKAIKITVADLAERERSLDMKEHLLQEQHTTLDGERKRLEAKQEELQMRLAAADEREKILADQEEHLKALSEAAELARKKYEAAAIESAEHAECLHQREIDAMTQQNVDLGKQLAELTQTLDDVRNELEETRAAYAAALQAANERLAAARQAANAELNETTAALNAARKETEARLSSAMVELEEARLEFNEEREELQKQLNAKQSTVDKLFVKIEELEAKADKSAALKKIAERESNFEVTKRNLTERIARLKENLEDAERQLKHERELRMSEVRTASPPESPDTSNSELKKLLRDYLVSVKHSPTPAEQAFLPALCALSDMPIADTKRVLTGVVPLPRI